MSDERLYSVACYCGWHSEPRPNYLIWYCGENECRPTYEQKRSYEYESKDEFPWYHSRNV